MSCIWRVVLPFNVQIILISSSFCHTISWIEDMMCWCKFIFSWLFSAKFRYYCMSKPPRGGLQSSPNKLLQYVTAGKAWYIISREKQEWRRWKNEFVVYGHPRARNNSKNAGYWIAGGDHLLHQALKG